MLTTIKSARILTIAAVIAIALSPTAFGQTRTGTLEINVTDEVSGEPLPVRMHIKNAAGKPVRPRGVTYWKDHFVFDGKIKLKLKVGDYTFEMERGPEYLVRTGNFSIQKKAEGVENVTMKRFVTMIDHGWYSGELHVHRPLEDIELLMRAEDLHVAPVITWWNNRNLWKNKTPPEELTVKFDGDRYYNVMAGEDEREGGALLYFNLKEPLPVADSSREYPSPVEFLLKARKHEGVHIDVEKPFWWDMPLWIATGKVDSIGLCNNHQWRSGMLATEAWGKPRDVKRYPAPLGNGRWSQDIYYHLLNCGLRIPPSAGSASGVLPNPVGYNRIYVHCGHKFTMESWFENLRAGRVVVTNGPIMMPRANGQLPGHVFHSQSGEPVELDVELKLFVREKVEYLELVKNGEVVQKVKLDQWAAANGKLPKVHFEKSGWLLVRAVTDNPQTYRFASSGPYYVEIDGKPRISKTSAQFFLDWVYERAKRIKLDDEAQRKEVLMYHRAARDFWKKKVEQANTD